MPVHDIFCAYLMGEYNEPMQTCSLVIALDAQKHEKLEAQAYFQIIPQWMAA